MHIIKKINTGLFFTIILLTFLGCSGRSTSEENAVEIFNFDNPKSFARYAALTPDSTHANLLNPQIAAAEYNEVRNAWIKLHQDLNQFLTDNNFDWESSDSKISVVHKIYFKSNGNIKYHFIKVLNPSVTKAKRQQFCDILAKFDSSYDIQLVRNSVFSQCGKASYPNYK